MLATIVQLDPIWVTFNASEQDVLKVRADLVSRGETVADCWASPVEVELQNETGYPHKGKLDYVAPNVDPSTGTLVARAGWRTATVRCCRAISCAFAFPRRPRPALLVPDIALGSDQSGRYVLVVNKDNVVEQRKVEPGPLSAICGSSTRA